MAGVQQPPTTGHAPPAADGLLRVSRFAEHLTLKHEHRITAEHGTPGAIAPGKPLQHRLGLGLCQVLHQLGWIGVVDRLLIHTTDPHPMGDARLLQQAAAGR